MKKTRLITAAFLSVFTLSVISSSASFAVSAEFEDFYSSNSITWYNPEGYAQACSPGSTTPGAITGTVQSFTDEYAQAAYDTGRANGIPWEIILSQAALESGWGSSSLTVQANNFFGIKAAGDWTGRTVTFSTKEQRPDGSEYTVNAAFRAYDSPADGFKGYAEFIRNNQRYSEALKYPNDPQRYIEEIKAAGYATDVAYVNKVLSAMSSIIGALGDKYGSTFEKSADAAATTPVDLTTTSSNACVCSATPQITSNGTLNGSSDGEKAFNYLVSQGFTKAGAAGMVGSLMIETGGGTYDFHPKLSNASGHRGIVQWDRSDRWPKLAAWAKSKGMDENTLEAQLAYIPHEMKTRYSTVYSVVTSTTSVSEAAGIVSDKYEIGGHKQKRIEYAQQAYNDFSGNTSDSGTPDINSGSANNCNEDGSTTENEDGGATIVDGLAFPLTPNKSVVENPGMFKNGTADQGGHPYTSYDIMAKTGTTVVAMRPGKVSYIGKDRCPGTFVSIFNKDLNRTTTYMHMSSNTAVKKGDTVTAGQKLGTVGTKQEGCTAPHLHIDEIKGGTRVSCSRLNCPAKNRALFVDIGSSLFKLYQKLP